MSSIKPRPASTSSSPSTLEGATALPFGSTSAGQLANPAAGTQDLPRFRPQVRRSLEMRPLLAAMVAAAVLLLCLACAFTQPKLYKAESLVYVEPIVARALNEPGAPGFDQLRYASYLEQQIQTITREDTLANALHSLPPGTWGGPKEREASAVARLQKALEVDRVLTSYQISISLKTPHAAESAAIVNAVTQAYLLGGRKDELSETGSRVQVLTEERDRITQELATDRKEQAALGASLGVAYPSAEGSNYFDQQLINLRGALASARQTHDGAEAQLASLSGPDASHRSGLTAAADDSIGSDPGLSSMKTAVNGRRAVLESQMAGLKPSNPLFKQDADEMADLDRSLDAMTARERDRAEHHIEDKLRTELQRSATVEAQINGQLAAETSKATGAGPKLQRASELVADLQRLTARFSVVDDTLNNLQLQASGPGLAHLALAATAPPAPEANKRTLFLIAALPLSLIFGTLAAVLARLRDRRVFIGADLEEVLGFAPLAVLPAREEVSPRVADEYMLRLAGGIEGAYRRSGARTFVLTLPRQTQGTGFALQSLVRKLHDLRLNAAVIGAAELLAASVESKEHTLAVSPGHGIAATRLERLKAAHDLVLIDAAPLLDSAETEYVVRSADATVLIVNSGVSLATDLLAATTLLSRLRVKGIAAVLQQLHREHADPAFRQSLAVIEERYQSVSADRPPQEEVPVVRAANEHPVPSAAVSDEAKPEPRASSEPVFTLAPAEEAPVAEPAQESSLELRDGPLEASSPVAAETLVVQPAAPAEDYLGVGGPGVVEPGALEPGALEPGALEPVALDPGIVEPVAVDGGIVEPVAVGPVAPELNIPELPLAAAELPAALAIKTNASEKVHLLESSITASPEAVRSALQVVPAETPFKAPVEQLKPAYLAAEQVVNGSAYSFTRSRLRLAVKGNHSTSNSWFTRLLENPEDSALRPAASRPAVTRPAVTSDAAPIRLGETASKSPAAQASPDPAAQTATSGEPAPSLADIAQREGSFRSLPSSQPESSARTRRAFARLDEIDRDAQAARSATQPTPKPQELSPVLPKPAAAPPLTRRWGLLSQFDSAPGAPGKKDSPHV